MDRGTARTARTAAFFGMMTMIFNALFFTFYDKYVEGFVNTRYLGLTSILSFLSGFAGYIAVVVTGATAWLG